MARYFNNTNFKCVINRFYGVFAFFVESAEVRAQIEVSLDRWRVGGPF